MSEVTGDLEKAIAASSQVLAVRGRVLPATLDHMVLWAEFEDGRYVEESRIFLKLKARLNILVVIQIIPRDYLKRSKISTKQI